MKRYVWVGLMLLLSGSVVMAAPGLVPAMSKSKPEKSLPGRLFYTPAQRHMLVSARAHKVTEIQKSYAPPESAPVSFDGIITRSDGVATRWINGRPHVGQPSANVHSLKPGQTRAQEKVYEPYQLQRRGEAPKLPKPKAEPDPAENDVTP